ncbi:MAG: hypothetical protein EO766_16680 [Hydrotalea sp. AMD]|uniref:hypothetical protein n=1 Tax=Hydrotalea sp. AMD TaxID=2501297 RepID=UPI001026747A|nr:hypothetical protein [Hydrotalea sp. AMD]RWZ85547.1 MAG: hypothetical protein EO766_16680 [Hydrotalea sp. AMD]
MSQKLITGVLKVNYLTPTLWPAETTRFGWIMRNLSGVTVYIGDKTVSKQTGFPIFHGEMFRDSEFFSYQGEIWLISDSGIAVFVNFLKFLS